MAACVAEGGSGIWMVLGGGCTGCGYSTAVLALAAGKGAIDSSFLSHLVTAS